MAVSGGLAVRITPTGPLVWTVALDGFPLGIVVDAQTLPAAQIAPDRGEGAGCQQPGSPGWPQHGWRRTTLMDVLAKNRRSFQPMGPGWVRFAHDARGEGFCSSNCRSPSFVEHIVAVPLLSSP